MGFVAPCLQSGLEMGFVAPCLQSGLERKLRHNHSYDIRVGLIEIMLSEHVCIWMKDSGAFQLGDSIRIFGSCQPRNISRVRLYPVSSRSPKLR
jgi:hypothetical protein